MKILYNRNPIRLGRIEDQMIVNNKIHSNTVQVTVLWERGLLLQAQQLGFSAISLAFFSYCKK